MNLGQMMMVIGAIVMLGVLILNTNSTIYQTNDIMYSSEFGVTAISLSTSLVEEAMGKMFDKVVADSNAAALVDSTLLTLPGSLGPEGGERYRGYPTGSGLKDVNSAIKAAGQAHVIEPELKAVQAALKPIGLL